MSLTYARGDIVFRCNGCPKTLATNTSNFDAAANALRRARWKPKQGRTFARTDWQHFCADCIARAAPQLPLRRRA